MSDCEAGSVAKVDASAQRECAGVGNCGLV